MPAEITHSGDTIRSLIPMSDDQHQALAHFVTLLREWNTRVNLISRKDEEQIWRNHILHCLALLAVVELPDRGAMLDLGTGGGMPGIPLAIMRPDVRLTLVDATAKKIRAVEDMVARLGLANVAVHWGRVEDDALLEQCGRKMDVVLARAVTRLSALVRWSVPLLRPAGPRRLYVWKGGDVTEEIAEARRHGAVHSMRVIPIALTGEEYFLREEKKIIEVRFS